MNDSTLAAFSEGTRSWIIAAIRSRTSYFACSGWVGIGGSPLRLPRGHRRLVERPPPLVGALRSTQDGRSPGASGRDPQILWKTPNGGRPRSGATAAPQALSGRSTTLPQGGLGRPL